MRSSRTIPFAIAAACLCFTAPAFALNVCADPDYLPFSNRTGDGFENKVALAIAQTLGEELNYTWATSRGHGGFPQFLSSTLDAKKCDVIMSVPYGSREELTTRPYYTSSYVFVFPKSKGYDIASMDSPILKRLKVGFERETPAEDALKIRGMLPGGVGFEVGEDSSVSPVIMLEALKSGKIDVLISWLPAIGAFLRDFPDMTVVAVPNQRTLGAPEQYTFPMSMGVREGDVAMKKKLDDVIADHQAELTSLLAQYGIR